MTNQKKLFVLGMITTICLIVAGYFLWKFITPGSVNFGIQSPKEVLAGENKSIKFILDNNTRLSLTEAEIKINLPEGVLYNGSNKSPTIKLDDLLAKQSIEKEIDLMFFGEVKTNYKIEAIFRYKPQGFSSLFEKKQVLNVLVSGSVFSLNITNPNQVLPETNFDTSIFWTNQKDISFSNILVQIAYPKEYVFNSSDSESIRTNETFDLGFVSKFQQGKINLNGSMRSQGGENKKFEIILGIKNPDSENVLVISKASSVVSLVSNPLNLSVLVNDQSSHAASVGESLNVKIVYKNNYNVPLNNLVLKVVFDGSHFDYKKLLPNKGYFTFGNKTITWTESQIPQLSTLNPGEQGEINFTIGLLSGFSIKTQNDKNFVMKINSSLESQTTPAELSPGSKIMASSQALVKLNSDISLETEGYFMDNKTTISNCGTLPVTVGQKTCFTMHLKMKNFANDVNNVMASVTLPYYVSYSNKFTASYNNPDINFDPFTKKLTWKIASLPANSGVITKPYEIVFQIEVAPTISEARQNIDLLTNIQIEAADSFTQYKISKTYREFRLNNIYDITKNSALSGVKEQSF